MYAVLRTGGKQYRVAAGDTIKVEKLPGKTGDPVELAEVLLVADGDDVVLGRPLVEGARIKAEILEQDRDRKLLIFKYKRRRRYRRKTGHRQPYTALRILDIVNPAAADAAVNPTAANAAVNPAAAGTATPPPTPPVG